MSLTTFDKPESLHDHVGEEIGVSDWFEVAQERINLFAEATLDSQWVHTDPERCARESPFGGPVAHGYLTLSLIPHLLWESVAIREPSRLTVNYGLNRARFPAPVLAGTRIRARSTVKAVEDFEGGVQVTLSVVVEIEGKEKPACVVEVVFRYYR